MHMVTYICIYIRVQLKSKLQHPGTWSAAAWNPTASVIAQQYSFATFASWHFLSSKEKLGVHVIIWIYFNCIVISWVWNCVVSTEFERKEFDVCLTVHHWYNNTGCNRRNGPDFGRVFLRSNYTDITQNTYIQSWTVTEILARERSGILWCLRTVLVSVTSFSPLLELHSYVRANVAPATWATGGAFSSV